MRPTRLASRSDGWRAVAAVAVAAVLVAVVTSDRLHGAVLSVIGAAERIIVGHGALGAVVFVVLSALSAMLAFFSSTVLVPIAIATWGKTLTALLLWLGWILGGAGAYAVGRHLGRPAAERLASARALARYDERITKRTPFRVVVLFQIAVPSEVPGYVLGLAGYGLAKYLLVQALVEIPWAVGAVWLGEGFLEQRIPLIAALVAAALLVTAVALRLMRARMGRRPITPTPPRGHGRGGATTRGVVDSRAPEPEP